MKLIISKYLTLSAVALLTLTSSAYADASKTEALKVVKADVSKVIKAKSSKVEIVPEIKIQAQDSSKKNTKLKDGKACNFDDLEEAEGEEFNEIPMAQSIPCADVDCKNLESAQLHKDSYKDLPETKSIKGCDK
jgi:hypothetical protein